jgi:hypothetical protein
MITHSLNDDFTVAIRNGLQKVEAPLADVVALAYAIISDLDPTGEASPVSRFITLTMNDGPNRGRQKLAILACLTGGRKTARYIADLIERPTTHANIQLIALEKQGRVRRYAIPRVDNMNGPGRPVRFEWEITDLGKHWLAVN